MKKLKLILSICIIIVLANSCSNSQGNSSDATKEYILKNGKIITLTETHPVGQSLSTIEITSKGFEHEFEEIVVDIDPISKVLIGDLDQNGYGEIYIVSNAAGSGSYGSVVGLASNKDKSLSQIYFPEVSDGDALFADYTGHDVFIIEDHKLIRSFPVFTKDSVNIKRRIFYGLYPGEAGWQLKLEDSDVMILNE